MRAAVSKLDPALPLISVRTMDDVIADNSQSQQFLSLLVGSFAGLAALLAAVGIYGVLSYAVTQRTREIGIRISLGATQGRVLAEVLREGMLLAAVGSAIGIAGALAAGKILTTLLYQVKPGDHRLLRPLPHCWPWWRWWRAICRRAAQRGSIRRMRCVTNERGRRRKNRFHARREARKENPVPARGVA